MPNQVKNQKVKQNKLSPYAAGTPIQDALKSGKPVGGDEPGMGISSPAKTQSSSNAPSKEHKRAMRDAYKQGVIGGAGGTQANDQGDRQYAATGQRQPEGQKQGFFDKLNQRQAERDTEAKQQQYAQDLARQKQEAKRAGSMGGAVGSLGGALAKRLTNKRARSGYGLEKGKRLANSLNAMGRNPAGAGSAMGRMAERERDLKRLNDQKRNEWKKNLMKGDLKGAWNKLKNRPKRIRTARYEHHRLMMWAVLIGMAIFKDLVDIGTVELISWIDWIIDACIGVTFYLVLGSKKLSFETRLVRSLIPAIMEMIPGLGIVPVWTFSVMYIYYRSEIATKLPAKPEEKKLPGT